MYCRGNQIVTLIVTFPKKITESQTEILKSFENESAITQDSSKTKEELSVSSAWRRLTEFLSKKTSK
jgi:DnaJ-class molecular chaperone